MLNRMTNRSRPGKSIRTAAAVGLFAALLAGCASELKSDMTKLRDARQAHVLSNPGPSPAIIEAIKTGEPVVGMTPDQVSASWGKPYRVNKFSGGRLEEWVFGCAYPHYCVRRDRGRSIARGMLFDRVIHMSRAYFSAGRLSEWTQ